MRIRIILLGLMLSLTSVSAFAQSMGAVEVGFGYGSYQRDNVSDSPWANSFVLEFGGRIQKQTPVYYSFFGRGSMQYDTTYDITFMTLDVGLVGVGFYLGDPLQRYENPMGRWFSTMDINFINFRYTGAVDNGDNLDNADAGYLQFAIPVHVQAWYMYTPTLGLGLYGEVAYVGGTSLEGVVNIGQSFNYLSGFEVKVGFSLVLL